MVVKNTAIMTIGLAVRYISSNFHVGSADFLLKRRTMSFGVGFFKRLLLKTVLSCHNPIARLLHE